MSVAIVNVGARTAIGLNARQTGFFVRAGFPALSEAPLANAAGEPITMGFVPTIDPLLVGVERLLALVMPVVEEAAGVFRDAKLWVSLSVDESEAKTGAVFRLESVVKRLFPDARLNVVADGESGFVKRWAEAVEVLELRQVDVVVLGGVHSDYDPVVIQGLEASGRLFSNENLDARIPGEAAGAIVLMRDGEAKRRGLSLLARVVGTGLGKSKATPENDVPAYGEQGLTGALKGASEGLAKTGQTAGWMLVDGTFEMYRMREWEAAFVRIQNVLGRPYIIESPAQRIGYLGAAAMPLLAGLAAMGWQYGYAPSPIAVVAVGNDGGDRAAMVLSSVKEAGRTWVA